MPILNFTKSFLISFWIGPSDLYKGKPVILSKGSNGDRFDQLAQQYYGDSSLWWVISIANNSFNQGSYFVTPGVQLRIPSQIGSIVASYNELNGY